MVAVCVVFFLFSLVFHFVHSIRFRETLILWLKKNRTSTITIVQEGQRVSIASFRQKDKDGDKVREEMIAERKEEMKDNLILS